LRDTILRHFDTVAECDGQKDGQNIGLYIATYADAVQQEAQLDKLLFITIMTYSCV